MTRKMQFYIQNSQKLITNLCILPSKNYKTKKEKNRTSKWPYCTIQRHSRVFWSTKRRLAYEVYEVFSFSFFEKRLAYEVMTHDCDRGTRKGQREPMYYVVSTLKAAVNHSKIKMVTSRGSRFIDPTVQYVNWKIESFFFGLEKNVNWKLNIYF